MKTKYKVSHVKLQGLSSVYNSSLCLKQKKTYESCHIYVAKSKALNSCAVTVQLVCTFVFAYICKKPVFSLFEIASTYESRHEKPCLQGFPPGLTQTKLYTATEDRVEIRGRGIVPSMLRKKGADQLHDYHFKSSDIYVKEDGS